MYPSISEDAIFIADAHYNKTRTKFEDFLNDVLNKNVLTSQLFLMGDMFDFLSNEISYFKTINKNIIEKINEISNTIEVIYLEGNHDFNLCELFPNVNIIKREKQPIVCQYNNKRIAISHGDMFTPFTYNIFTFFFRNTLLLQILNVFDINNKISIFFEKKLEKKIICNEIEDFKSFAQNRIELYKYYNSDLIIEGHFHQGKEYKSYVNVHSYACKDSYYQLS